MFLKDKSILIGIFTPFKLRNDLLISCLSINAKFLLLHTEYFDKRIIPPFFVLTTFSYSFSTLFIKTNSSWLIAESIKALEIKTFPLFNSDFADDKILLCFFLFFLIFDLKF